MAQEVRNIIRRDSVEVTEEIIAKVAITGANRGIGLELCKQFTLRGDRVVAFCRTASSELSATDASIVEGVDVASDTSVQRAIDRVSGETFDILINNAGIFQQEVLGTIDFSQIRDQFETNALGPLRISEAFLPRLAKGAKIAIITSRMGSIADNTSGSRYGYRMSKAAVNMAGVSLAHDLKPNQIAVALIHPGFVRTAMTGHQGSVDPAVAATGIIERIDALTLSTSGKFWHANGEELPW